MSLITIDKVSNGYFVRRHAAESGGDPRSVFGSFDDLVSHLRKEFDEPLKIHPVQSPHKALPSGFGPKLQDFGDGHGWRSVAADDIARHESSENLR